MTPSPASIHLFHWLRVLWVAERRPRRDRARWSGDVLLQFLSSEGDFTANGGVVIALDRDGCAPGRLHVAVASQRHAPGAVNPGQTLEGCAPTRVRVESERVGYPLASVAGPLNLKRQSFTLTASARASRHRAIVMTKAKKAEAP